MLPLTRPSSETQRRKTRDDAPGYKGRGEKTTAPVKEQLIGFLKISLYVLIIFLKLGGLGGERGGGRLRLKEPIRTPRIVETIKVAKQTL